MEEEKEIELRSEEVQEVLSHVPNWMVRWGISVIFGLIVMLVVLAWFIKYPEVIEGQVRLTTETPPVKLTAQINARIQKVNVSNGDTVQKGAVIAELENPLDSRSVETLNELLDTFMLHYENDSLGPYEFDSSISNLGEIQPTVNEFRSAAEEYFSRKFEDYNVDRIKNFEKQITHHQHLSHVYTLQMKRGEKELQNATEKNNSDKKLYEKGVISKMEYFAERSKYVQKQEALENIKTQVIQNNITITNLEKQLIELKFEQDELIRKLQVKLETLLDQIQNQLTGWQQTYVLKAPHSGVIDQLAVLSLGQSVKAGDPLFAVLPEDQKVVGYVEVPAHGIGKVEQNQRVTISLSNYPAQEFGQIKGEVVSLSQIPKQDPKMKQNTYLAKVELTEGLKTTYNKDLEHQAEMVGTASIITEDLSVLQRIFNQFRTLFDE
tara:strand:+ start:149290 stop:150597 length:1308 start_codon:yes stop_codon:yes gene_type:complete